MTDEIQIGDLADLIKRVEAATDESRELWREAAGVVFGKPLSPVNNGDWFHTFVRLVSAGGYTDAVISLIGERMPGFDWTLEARRHGAELDRCHFDAELIPWDIENEPVFFSDAPTPALALLLAFLRAWEARSNA